uniref:Uncharacterized protein n=1 Tax=Oryza brachyantha TaxID=4533 RepID=J3LBE3_ORYBR
MVVMKRLMYCFHSNFVDTHEVDAGTVWAHNLLVCMPSHIINAQSTCLNFLIFCCLFKFNYFYLYNVLCFSFFFCGIKAYWLMAFSLYPFSASTIMSVMASILVKE